MRFLHISYKMHFFKILLIIGYTVVSCRPILDGGDREASDVEYEGNDDNKQDEYLNDDQENPSDEVSDADLKNEKDSQQNQKRTNNYYLRRESNTYKQNTNKIGESNEEVPAFLENSEILDMKNSNAARNIEYSGDEVLFKVDHGNTNRDKKDYNNEHFNTNDENKISRPRYRDITPKIDESLDRSNYANAFNIRDRRQATSNEKGEEVTNENNENSIIKNLKKLSDKDLENLLNSLSEDRKAIFRKFIDKREITKKAGAVDDNGFDTSKIEGSFAIHSKAEACASTDASEVNKQNEGDESSTKPHDNENEPEKSENKSGIDINAEQQSLEQNVAAVTLNKNNDNEANLRSTESSKNDNKREINSEENRKEVHENINSNDDINDSLPVYQEPISLNNDDYLECKDDNNNNQKREISQGYSFENDNSIRSLEESFPNADAYDETSFNMEPLVRVKRTELKHKVKKRDLTSLVSNEVPYIPGFREKDYENIEASEFENKKMLNYPSAYISDKKKKTNNFDTIQFDRLKSESTDAKLPKLGTDKSSFGSDTDSVLSNIEGVDDNIMYNSKIRNKKSIENSTGINKTDIQMNLVRNSRTIDPNANNINLKLDNSVDTPQYQGEKSFLTDIQNPNEDRSRSKRT